MLEHIAKRQAEQRDSIRKSFMTSGGSDASNGAEYSQSSNEDVTKSGMKKTMDEWKEGDLKSGSGAKVTNQKQAIAIGLSEEDKEKKTKKKGEGDEEVEKGDEGEGGVVAGTEAWDEKKDKTKLTKGYPPTTTGMTPQQHKELTKSETMIDYLSNGEYHEHQKAQILATYGVTDIQKSKTGEGSKGGKVIGHTSSGKAIYSKADHTTHTKFTKEDHEDAADLHSAIAYHYGRGQYDGEDKKHHRNQANEHASAAKHLFDKENEPIGKTKSGKSIHKTFDHPEHKKFTNEDHEDAEVVHGKLAKKQNDIVATEGEKTSVRATAREAFNNHVTQAHAHRDASQTMRQRDEEVSRARELTGLKKK